MGGLLSRVVIVIENGINNPSSNSGGSCLYSLFANAHWKGVNPFVPSSAIGK